ncbi:MAG: hypothetical protein ACOY9Y_12725 [Bacillota bacterium]
MLIGRILRPGFLLLAAFLVILLVLAVFFLAPALRKPLPETPPAWWDVMAAAARNLLPGAGKI